MQHISHGLFDITLFMLINLPRNEQKSILTDNYERGVISDAELSYGIMTLDLADA